MRYVLGYMDDAEVVTVLKKLGRHLEGETKAKFNMHTSYIFV
jgi:hypothetical protein